MPEKLSVDAGKLLTKLFEKLQVWLESFVVMLPNFLLAFVVIAIGVFVSKWVQRGVQRILARATRNEPISRLFGSLSRICVISMAFLGALSLLHLDKAVTSMLAGVGVVGLALGFAFQDIAANFMSGFMMAVHRPFKVGDTVEVAERQCRVVRVELRATEVETMDGLSILIPNREIFQKPIINYTRTRQRRMDLSIGTAYCDDMSKVRSLVLEAVKNVPHRDMSREIEVFFKEFGDSSINFDLRIWLDDPDPRSYAATRSEAMIAVKRAFDKNNITIPFPIRTLDFGAKVVGGERLDEMKWPMAAAQR